MSRRVLIALSLATGVVVALSNVIRVYISEEVAVASRSILFAGCWMACAAWAAANNDRATGRWILLFASATAIIAACMYFSGGIELRSLFHVCGPFGAGIGIALSAQRCLVSPRKGMLGAGALMIGFLSAAWLALEGRLELWKLIPNSWEILKGLEYPGALRMGEVRSRFIFTTPMEAGVFQWLLGSIAICIAAIGIRSKVSAGLLFLGGVLLVATVTLTYSRAGIAMGVATIALLAIARRPERGLPTGLLLGVGVAAVILIAAPLALYRGSVVVQMLESTMDPTEEANRVRINQWAEAGESLVQTPWHGRGADDFIVYNQFPRTMAQSDRFQVSPLMPRHEITFVSVVSAFGLGGVFLSLLFALAVILRIPKFGWMLRVPSRVQTTSFDFFMLAAVPPFLAYSLFAPVLSGPAIGLVTYSFTGGLIIWGRNEGSGLSRPIRRGADE